MHTTRIPGNGTGLGNLKCDGSLSSMDAIFMKQALTGYSVEESINSNNMDVNGDRMVDSRDAFLMMQKLAGYEVEVAS